MSAQSAHPDRKVAIGGFAVRWIAVLGGLALLAVIVAFLFPALPGAFYVRGYGAAVALGCLISVRPTKGLNFLDRCTFGIAVFGGVILLAIMLLTVVDVSLRKCSGVTNEWFANLFCGLLFSEEFRTQLKPIRGATELSQMALAVVVACSLGYGARTGAHVAVDIVNMVGGRVITRWTDIAVRVLGIAVLAPLSWQLYLVSGRTKIYGLETTELHIDHAPFYIALSIGTAIYMTILIVELLVGLHAFRADRDPSEHN